MVINWLGHSCFVIKGNRATIVTDPFSTETGYKLPKTSADVVTVSHDHPGHSNAAAIEGQPKVIQGPGEYEVGGVLVIGLRTFHDNQKGADRGKNTAYLLTVDDVTICHLGDLGHALSGEHEEELDSVDILMLPVGGNSTINAAEAAEVVRLIEPKIVLPMHYQTDVYKGKLDPVDGFLKEMGISGIEPQPKLTVTKSNLPLVTQVQVLTC